MWTESTEVLFNNINIKGSSKSTSVIVLGSAHVQLFIDFFVSKTKILQDAKKLKDAGICTNLKHSP